MTLKLRITSLFQLVDLIHCHLHYQKVIKKKFLIKKKKTVRANTLSFIVNHRPQGFLHCDLICDNMKLQVTLFNLLIEFWCSNKYFSA